MQGQSTAAQRSLKQKRKQKALPYLYIAPFGIAFVLFFAFPAIYSLVLSFFHYKGYGPMEYAGLTNYIKLLNYGAFHKAVGNTFFYFFAHIIPVMIGAFLLAAAMQSKAVGALRKAFKPIIFLPQIVPVIAAALVFRIMFSTHSGAINQMLGIQIPWLDNRGIMRWIVVLMVVWRASGWFMVVFLSGLTTINDELYEAALLDGASAWQKLTRITVPLMKPFFLFAFVMDAISSFKIYTEPNLLLSAEAKIPTDVAPMMNMVTMNIRGGSFGLASAAGWLLFLIIFLIALIELYVLRSKE